MTVEYRQVGTVAVVTLNRPAVLNAYNMAMRDALWELLRAASDDPSVHSLVLRGSGRAFCAGADLTEFGSAPSQAIARQVRARRDIFGFLARFSKPTIAALHGYALGSGLEIALLCDVRIAAPGTKLGLPEVRWGMIPAAGGTQTLPRAAGVALALDMLLTGRTIGTDEAFRRGIVSQIVEEGRLFDVAIGIADRASELRSDAVALAKRAVTEGLGLSVAAGLRLEARLARRLQASS